MCFDLSLSLGLHIDTLHPCILHIPAPSRQCRSTLTVSLFGFVTGRYIESGFSVDRWLSEDRVVLLLREAIKSDNRLHLGNHPNRGGGTSKIKVVSQPLTFTIITCEKNHHLKRFFPNFGGGEGGLGRLGWFPKFNRL